MYDPDLVIDRLSVHDKDPNLANCRLSVRGKDPDLYRMFSFWIGMVNGPYNGKYKIHIFIRHDYIYFYTLHVIDEELAPDNGVL